ncbi:sister chromatid cohesion DCC1 [Labeo rohita]|uniref:Sister chromatid cohesion protein DCC1 n=1 Tax=Labeo rohita TaxID=84645 RepID=A0A498MYP2_LABRO|nr:sister chromatid cohesion DCC1 [Labeo rohita]
MLVPKSCQWSWLQPDIQSPQAKRFWRILDFDYEMKLLGHVTQLIDSESWSFSKVPLSVCLEELGSLEPNAMIEHCLNCYGRRYNNEDGQVMYALDEDKVCRATAQLLLQNAVKFNLSEFQEVWQQSVPEGMSARLDQLRITLYHSEALSLSVLLKMAVKIILMLSLHLCLAHLELDYRPPVKKPCTALSLSVLLKMAVKIILMLSLHLCLAHLELDYRPPAKKPCTRQCNWNQKENFLKKHLPENLPETFDIKVFKMIAFLLLMAFVLPQSHSADTNSKPCMPARHNNAHNVFLKRHIPDDVPRTWDNNAWETFLRKIKTCDRPTQSFFRASEKQRVENVCTKAGGKTLSGNLCISKEKFSFVTVRVNVNEGACGIRNINNETKHIILACEQIGDVCQPVHFEGNPQSTAPSNNQLDCGSKGSSGTKTTVITVFTFLLPLIAMVYIL